jgi:hypothetical protein
MIVGSSTKFWRTIRPYRKKGQDTISVVSLDGRSLGVTRAPNAAQRPFIGRHGSEPVEPTHTGPESVCSSSTGPDPAQTALHRGRMCGWWERNSQLVATWHLIVAPEYFHVLRSYRVRFFFEIYRVRICNQAGPARHGNPLGGGRDQN